MHCSMKRLDNVSEKKEKTAIGLMSGTSVDGIDAVLLTITGCGIETRITERAFITVPYPQEVRQRLLALASGSFGGSEELSAMNFYLGELFADACFAVCKEAGADISTVDFIGSHGHTVFHAPNERCYFGKNIKSTLQIGEAAVIAERTGCVTVADFRVRDVAAGGAGAPLVPFTEYLLYREPGTVIGLQNIGGIGNITLLPATADMNDIIAFDTGPGNMLIDGLMRLITDNTHNYDEDGKLAATGTVDSALLEFLKTDSYLQIKPPKTTGREYYSEAFIRALYEKGGALQLPPETIVRTATYYTAYTIAYSLNTFGLPMPKKLIVGGGGSKNPVILAHLRQLLPECSVLTNEDIGKNSDSKEACAFAVLANEALCGNPNNVPSATGAKKFVVMGKISFADAESSKNLTEFLQMSFNKKSLIPKLQ